MSWVDRDLEGEQVHPPRKPGRVKPVIALPPGRARLIRRYLACAALKRDGFSGTEIASFFGLSGSQVYRDLDRTRRAADEYFRAKNRARGVG